MLLEKPCPLPARKTIPNLNILIPGRIMIFLNSNIKITKHLVSSLLVKFFIGFLIIVGLSSCSTPAVKSTPTASPTQTRMEVEPTQTPEQSSHTTGTSRGYMTTPQELTAIAKKAEQGIEPYQSAVNDVVEWADREWKYEFKAHENCSSADR